jgi:sec-independent protein translocase protein TatC
MTRDDMPKSLVEHLTELRTRLMWVIGAMLLGTCVSFMYVEEITGFLVEPLAHAMRPGDTQRLIYTGLTEAFFTYMKVAFFAGIFLTFPVMLWQIWIFVAPGLYKNERRAFLPYLIATPVLFFMGGACVYYGVIPMAWPFFMSFQSNAAQTALPIELEARISEYLDLIMTLIFAFGLCFQMPVVLSLMARVGLITAKNLSDFRKFAIIIIFTVAAVLTPPDVMSQVMLALPLMGLYEFSILLIRWTSPKHDEKPDAADNAAGTV